MIFHTKIAIYVITACSISDFVPVGQYISPFSTTRVVLLVLLNETIVSRIDHEFFPPNSSLQSAHPTLARPVTTHTRARPVTTPTRARPVTTPIPVRQDIGTPW